MVQSLPVVKRAVFLMPVPFAVSSVFGPAGGAGCVVAPDGVFGLESVAAAVTVTVAAGRAALVLVGEPLAAAPIPAPTTNVTRNAATRRSVRRKLRFALMDGGAGGWYWPYNGGWG